MLQDVYGCRYATILGQVQHICFLLFFCSVSGANPHDPAQKEHHLLLLDFLQKQYNPFWFSSFIFCPKYYNNSDSWIQYHVSSWITYMLDGFCCECGSNNLTFYLVVDSHRLGLPPCSEALDRRSAGIMWYPQVFTQCWWNQFTHTLTFILTLKRVVAEGQGTLETHSLWIHLIEHS